jgi:hypothetical protein
VLRIRADRDAVLPFRVPGDAVTHFPGQVEAAPVGLEHVHDPEALLVVLESARHERLKDLLAGVTERRVAEIVTERDRLGQFLVQPQHLGDTPGDLRHLERVREPRAVVVSLGREEYLGLVLQPAERSIDHAISRWNAGESDPASRRSRPFVASLLAPRRENLMLTR